jgi:hypothetical protein
MSERERTRLGLPDLVRPMLAVPGELPAGAHGAWGEGTCVGLHLVLPQRPDLVAEHGTHQRITRTEGDHGRNVGLVAGGDADGRHRAEPRSASAHGCVITPRAGAHVLHACACLLCHV